MEYFFNKVRLCKQLDLGMEKTKMRVVTGLWSRSTSTVIMSRTHTIRNDLLRNIQEFESLESAWKQRIGVRPDDRVLSSKQHQSGTEKKASQWAGNGQQSQPEPSRTVNSNERKTDAINASYAPKSSVEYFR